MRRITTLLTSLILALILTLYSVGPVFAAAINRSPASGSPGTSVTVTGTGFGGNESGIIVTYDGTSVVTGITADSSGGWSATFTVPASVSGAHTIDAYSANTSAATVTDFAFSVTPSISLSRTSGSPGTSLTVTGAGFSGNETSISVTYGGTIVISAITASALGAWSSTFTVPASAAGAHTIDASGANTTAANVLDATFTITPSINLNRTNGSPGTSLTVTGSGFGNSETGINVTYDGITAASSISATTLGAWSATFNVPASASGSHTIDASGANTALASVADVTFTVIPVISLSRTNGAPESALTVTGAGFGASETGILVTYDGAAVASGISATAQGAWSTIFAVPASNAGIHTIDASGATTAAPNVADVTFTVVPSIALSQASAPPGSSLTVTGSRFSASETGISVTYDGKTVVSGISANIQGAWSASFVVPTSVSGIHTIDASGATTAAPSVADVTFSVVPGISLNRASGSPGSSVTVTGAGFGNGEPGINVTYDGTAIVSSISASAQGSWSATLAVPASASGIHSIDAYSITTPVASVTDATFTILPSISLNRTNGSSVNSETVTGAGFGAGETGITVTYDGTSVASAITATAQGAWSATFTVPASASGMHTVGAYGKTTPATSVDGVSFSMTAASSINPTFGSVGTPVEVTGSGFTAGSNLRFTYDNTEIYGAGVITDDSGSFSQSITVPKSVAGTHIIRVIDAQKNESKLSFTMESTSPPVPRLLSPGDGAVLGILGGVTPTFKWSNVTDPSGVTFVLQVDINSDFVQPLLERTDISSSSYTLTQAEALPRDQYYWRVRAIDGASNQSAWSPVWSLTSGRVGLGTLITIVVLVVILGIITYLWMRLSGRKRAPIPVPETTSPQVTLGQWREVEPEEAPRPRMLPLPWRRALPEPSKTVKVLSAEEQGRLRVIADFAQSLPLVEPGYTAEWIIDLMRTSMGIEFSLPTYEQSPHDAPALRYEPAWTRHPLYLELQTLLAGQPIVTELNSFVDTVSQCASEAVGLLQQIYHEALAEISLEPLAKGEFRFVFAIYSDAISWFRGKSLEEPAERDYTIAAVVVSDSDTGLLWLHGATSTTFAGSLIPAQDEPESLRLRVLHLKLRRTYRNVDRAKQLVAILSKLEVQRSRLITSLKQLSNLAGIP